MMNTINDLIYNKFNLSEQAIIIPDNNIHCLYFDFWGVDFIDIFYDFFMKIMEKNIYISNGYKSNEKERFFLELEKQEFIKFIYSKNYKVKDYTCEDFEMLGVIITGGSFSWLIHRDPDFGTISFAYDKMFKTDIIKNLKSSKYYVGNVPKPSFYTDEY